MNRRPQLIPSEFDGGVKSRKRLRKNIDDDKAKQEQLQTKKMNIKKRRSYSLQQLDLLYKIGQGTDGKVYRAKHKNTGEILAVKRVEYLEKFYHETIQEIQILESLNHPSIVNLKHAVVEHGTADVKSRAFLVMEYAETDLRSLLRLQKTMKQRFTQSEVKCLMQQLLRGVEYLHANRVIHRDLKTSNLLLKKHGELKICDFGLACEIDEDECSVLHEHTVVTLPYRAPELMVGAEWYSTEIDMWSVGCIMAELMSRQTLFDGDTESEQLEVIFKILGSPDEETWPGFSELVPELNSRKHRRSKLRQMFPVMCFTGELPVVSNAGFDLLSRLLMYDPKKRITAKEALDHHWFREVPLPKSKNSMPSFPSRREE